MKGFGIRPANEDDVLVLAALAEEFMPGEAGAEERIDVLKESLENRDYELLVVELEGRTVGFVDQWIVRDFVHGAKLSHIQSLYVTPQYRGKGIGSKLLQAIIENAKTKGVSEVHVTTEFNNRRAIELYKRQGLVKESLQLEMGFTLHSDIVSNGAKKNAMLMSEVLSKVLQHDTFKHTS